MNSELLFIDGKHGPVTQSRQQWMADFINDWHNKTGAEWSSVPTEQSRELAGYLLYRMSNSEWNVLYQESM